MRYRYLDDFRRGISVFAIFSYGIAVLGTPQCPPPCAVRDGDLRYEIDRKTANKTARPYFCACQERASGQTKIPVRARVKTNFQTGERLVSAGPLFRWASIDCASIIFSIIRHNEHKFHPFSEKKTPLA